MKRPASFLSRSLLSGSLAMAAATARGGVNQWTSIGPEGGAVYALVVDPASSGVVYAATGAGVFKTVDGGGNWVKTGFETGASRLAIDPDSPSTLYSVSGGGLLFKSTDWGATWQASVSGLAAPVTAVAIHPETPSTLYAIAAGAVYRSRDAAASWARVYKASDSRTNVTALAVSASAVLAGLTKRQCDICPFSGGIVKSVDGGEGWSVNPVLSQMPIHAITVDPIAGTTIYAGVPRRSCLFCSTSPGAVYKSTDGGAIWYVYELPTGDSVQFVSIDPRNPSVLYAGDPSGVFRSTDGAATWASVLKIRFAAALAIDPVSGDVYAGSGDGVSRSTDGGTGWTLANHGLGATRNFYGMAIDPDSPARIYAGTYDGLFWTADAGATWTKVTLNVAVRKLVIDPAAPSTVYAATDSGVFRSSDRGATWIAMNAGLGDQAIGGLAIDPGTPTTLYAIGGTGIFKTTDRGANWAPVSSGLTGIEGYSCLAIDPISSTVYAGTFQTSVFRSSDGGASWTPVNNGLTAPNLYALMVTPGAPSRLYAATNEGVFQSADGGASWTIHRGSGPAAASSLAPDPTSPSTVYASDYVTVFRSVDGGESWSATTGPVPGYGVTSIAVDPKAPSTVYATAYGGVFAITNPAEPCVAGPTTLCLAGGRFRVEVDWRAANLGTSGSGRAVPLTSDTGVFWFFQSSNLELMVKVLDATSFSGYFWVFYGALSDVEYTIRVTDTEAGSTKTYFNPQGHQGSRADTSAFPGPGGTALQYVQGAEAATVLSRDAACKPGPTALCLSGGRFRVEVAWEAEPFGAGAGQTVALTSDSGAFWFFQPTNLELMIKVLDARTIDGHFWVYYGALSDVAYTITITDTKTGAVKTYRNPKGHLGGSADTAAFLDDMPTEPVDVPNIAGKWSGEYYACSFTFCGPAEGNARAEFHQVALEVTGFVQSNSPKIQGAFRGSLSPGRTGRWELAGSLGTRRVSGTASDTQVSLVLQTGELPATILTFHR